MRVAIIGSRNCNALDAQTVANRLPDDCSLLISGGAGGVDALAETVAKEKHIPFLKILPNYEKYGRQAPLVRNKEIVEQVDQVLAFWDFHSPGTANTIAHCISMQVPVEVFEIQNDR